MGEGHEDHAVVVVTEAELLRVDEEEGDVRPVGANDPLRLARGPGGVHEDPGIIRPDLNGGGGLGPGFEEPLEGAEALLRLRRDVDEPVVVDPVEVAPDRIDGLPVLPLGDDGPGLRVVDDVEDLFSGESKIDRNDDQPGLRRGEIDLDELEAVVGEDGHPVPSGQAEPEEAVGQLVGPHFELAEGEGAPGVLEGDLLRDLASVDVENLSDMQPVHSLVPPSRKRVGS